MTVAAASGDLTTSYKCNSFAWKMQGYEFKAEIRTLPLGCSDLVLGVQWLSTLGPILWDFLNLRMEFKFQGLKHVLRGITPNSSKVVNGSSLNKLILQDPQMALLHLDDMTALTEHNSLLIQQQFSTISKLVVQKLVPYNSCSIHSQIYLRNHLLCLLTVRVSITRSHWKQEQTHLI